MFNIFFHFGKSESLLKSKILLKLNVLKSKNYCTRLKSDSFCITYTHYTLYPFFLELVQESLKQDFCLHLPSLVSLESIINMDIHIWIFGPWRTLRLFKCQEKKPEGNNVHVFYTKGVKGDKVEFVQEFNFKF